MPDSVDRPAPVSMTTLPPPTRSARRASSSVPSVARLTPASITRPRVAPELLPRAELLHQPGNVDDVPVLGDLPVADPHEVHHPHRHVPARRRDPEELPLVRAVERLVRRDQVAVRDPVDH